MNIVATTAKSAKTPRPAWVFWVVPPALLILVVLLSFRVGRFPVSTGDIVEVLTARIAGREPAVPPVVVSVLCEVRLPRVLAGIVVGGALSMAGAVFQGMFRNPLVSPDILGASAGAGFGATACILLGLPVMAIQGGAFLFGLSAVAAVAAIAGLLRRHERTLVLVLTGIAVTALADAGGNILKILADPYTQLPTITYWMMGSLNGVTVGDVEAAAVPVVIGAFPLWFLRWRANLLCLEDDEAQSLGVQTAWLRGGFIVAATLMTSAAVAISGSRGWQGPGWVGLVVPHLSRLLVGADFTRLLPTSFILGAGFLVVADCVARSISTMEIPLGTVVSLVGVPFFLWLLATRRRVW